MVTVKIKTKTGEMVNMETEPGQRLSEFLRKNKIKCMLPCCGHHNCGGCKIIGKAGLDEMSESERAFLTDNEISKKIRLACFAYIVGEAEIEIGVEEQNTIF